MKIINKYIIIIVMTAIIVSCKEQESKQQTITQTKKELPLKDTPPVPKGNHVPNDEVCMVNDIHMGKKQMEVPFDGKTYYGCCNMCIERIPNDETVRLATDPLTGEKTDKATAYIISLNDHGNVAYFQSEENYHKFLKANEPRTN